MGYTIYGIVDIDIGWEDRFVSDTFYGTVVGKLNAIVILGPLL
ncbi:hypothetical protein LCGC14_0145720 [marine sediment metagenome]|uniref:Uncharacterized protein n=1 Tax=marine sediment metagenome TaxID=412755 RepID=A0A0F9XHB3_9ZZZZ